MIFGVRVPSRGLRHDAVQDIEVEAAVFIHMVYKLFSGRKRRKGKGAVRISLLILSDKFFYLFMVGFFIIT